MSRIKTKIIITQFILFFCYSFSPHKVPSWAGQPPTVYSDIELAKRFTPVLYFHPDEIFRPQPVDILVQSSRLRENRSFWFDTNILTFVQLDDLVTYHEPNFFLDIWYGNSGESDYKNYTAHRQYYLDHLDPENGGPQISAYAHVIHDDSNNKIIIQYWLFYYYNDWFNKHEGDWELIEIILDTNYLPEWVICSQHHGGTKRTWAATQIEENTHPVIYVALGSHANYFWGNEIYPNGMNIGNSRLEILDRTGDVGRVIPRVILLPSREEAATNSDPIGSLNWIIFKGHWGEQAGQEDFGGPTGPADKGEQWSLPYEWGVSQPLDQLTWFKNRLSIQIIGENAAGSAITFKEITAQHDASSGFAILHQEPSKDRPIVIEITANISDTTEIIATWPSVDDSRITRYIFQNLPTDGYSELVFEFSIEGNPQLISIERNQTYQYSYSVTSNETWDSPDFIWQIGYLPASQIIVGIFACLLAGIAPIALFVLVVYNSDKYEKEPKSLINAVFFWGSLPALLTTLIVRILFGLSPDMLGPNSLEAAQVGIFAPFLEEILKGLVLVYVAFRYQHEFNDMLDGIVYGSLVGLGYAMTSNIISYLAAFLFHGFGGLGVSIIVKGIIFSLNQALYSSIFGIGLWLGNISKKKANKFSIILSSLVIAGLINSIHNLLFNNIVGLNFQHFLITWAGTLTIIAVILLSLQKQQKYIEYELIQEIPLDLYQIMIKSKRRKIALKNARQLGGNITQKRVRRQFQLLMELAFSKARFRRFPNNNLATKIDNLREEIDLAILVQLNPDENVQ